MSCYHHLTIEEREKLYAFLQRGLSLRNIASMLHRSPSTISRELKRNQNCLPHVAQERYRLRRKRCVRRTVLSDPYLHKLVHFCLGYLFWSPEQISYRLKLEHERPIIGVSTIYRALDNGLLQDTLRYYLRIKYKTMGKASKKQRKCFSKSIDQRPEEANDRSKIGHWEGDTIVNKKSKTVFVTLVDRKSRFLAAGRVESKEAARVGAVVIDLMKKTGKPVRSITFDQGPEFSENAIMEAELNTDIYFAHPHSPWERPSNENTNGLLRQFMPKWTDFGMIQEEDLRRFVMLINCRPRKCLNWHTPFEVFSHQVLRFT